jgi:hypothetical protein
MGKNKRWEKLFTYCLAPSTRIYGVPPSRFSHSSVLCAHNVGLHPVHSVLSFLLRKRTPCTYSVLLLLIWKRTPYNTRFFGLWSENVHHVMLWFVCDVKTYTLYILSSSICDLKRYSCTYPVLLFVIGKPTPCTYLVLLFVILKPTHVHTQFFCLWS